MPDVRAVEGTLWGMAVGDALGLPYENLTPDRAERLLGPPDRFRLLLGRGLVSDDTEHACMTAQALLVAGRDEVAFARELARGLRRWIALAPAGTGKATAQACFKLLLGWSPERSGVFSAGNGPAMRAPLLGAAVDDPGELRRLIARSTRLTHTDPKAEWGAWAVALAAHQAARSAEGLAPSRFVAQFVEQSAEPTAPSDAAARAELLRFLEQAAASAERDESAREFAGALGLKRGVTGYVYHTVPVVLQAWFRHPRDYRSAVDDVLRAGGDADTTGAMVGGLVGAAVGREGILPEWQAGLADWPLTGAWITRLAQELVAGREAGEPRSAPRLAIWAMLPRNLLFLAVVLAHGLRRLAPPY